MLLQFAYLLFFNNPATTDIYTLSLHDALPISSVTKAGNPDTAHDLIANYNDSACTRQMHLCPKGNAYVPIKAHSQDRKSTRLNSSHVAISYAVFCLKKKKTKNTRDQA